VSIEGAITESDIANYLANTPGFFERHAELLASIQLSSPHGQRAVSLQERQMEMLREKHKGLEQQIMEMVRHGRDNVAIADRLQRFTRAILLAPSAAALPGELLRALKHEFMVPQAALRLFAVDPAFASQPFAQPVSDETRSFVTSLAMPYCGINSGFEPVGWLDEPATVLSLALIPLSLAAGSTPIGLLVLGSPDPSRYAADMGTEFLARLGDVSAAGLSRLLPAAAE
jgi:hypothetical protein